MATVHFDISSRFYIVNIYLEIDIANGESASICFGGKTVKIDKSTQGESEYKSVTIAAGSSAKVITQRGEYEVIFTVNKTVRIIGTPDKQPSTDCVDAVIIDGKRLNVDYSKEFKKIINLPIERSGTGITLINVTFGK